MKHPLYTVSVLSPCFIMFYILMILCIIIGQVSLHSVYYFFLSVLVFIASVITWIISCRASCSADRHSHTSRKPDHHILVVFVFNLLVIYLPFTVFSFFIYFNPLFCGLLSVFCIPSFNLPQAHMTQFYSAVIESVLCSSITVWFGSASKSDIRRLQRTVRTAERIIGVHLPSLQDLYYSRVKKRAGNIITDPSHPGHDLFALLPSGRLLQISVH